MNTYQITDENDAAGTYPGIGGKRDYIQEAKDYFKHKLLMYGIGTEVPIRSLMGHRSQASPQVRHISGQHFKEFTDFLMKHTDYFKVIDDHVVLVDCDDQDVPASDRLHLPQASIDTKATQQLLDFFAQCIENKGECGGVETFLRWCRKQERGSLSVSLIQIDSGHATTKRFGAELGELVLA